MYCVMYTYVETKILWTVPTFTVFFKYLPHNTDAVHLYLNALRDNTSPSSSIFKPISSSKSLWCRSVMYLCHF